jgi:hypothetical protein
MKQATAEDRIEFRERSGKGSSVINAGGIDEYFSTEAERLDLLRF